MIVITGAAGNVGSKIASELLAEGKEVKVIGRDSKTLEPLVEQGAVAAIGNLEDSNFLTDTFRGASVVFTMIPTNVRVENMRDWQNKIGSSIASAIEKADVSHVVNLSSLGADLETKTGPVLGLHDQEQRLNALSNLNIVHLRPSSFMENLYLSADSIKAQNVIGSTLDGALEFPNIATRDIAKVAVELLSAPNFSGKSARILLGQRDLSMNEMTQIISGELGKQLSYVQLSPDEMKKELLEMGASEDVANSYNELYQSIDEEFITVDGGRNQQNTTTTSFEEFAKEFAQSI